MEDFNQPILLPLTIVQEPITVGQGMSQITQEMRLLNNTNLSIYIGTREGLIYALNPVRDYTASEGVLVRRTYSYDNNRVSVAIPEHRQGFPGIFQGHVHGNHSPNYCGAKSILVDNEIKQEILERYTTVYYEDLDIVVSLKANGWQHPRISGKEINHIEDNETSLRFELVDYNGYYGDSYININGYVHKVKANKRQTKQEGLYIYYQNVTREGIFKDIDIEYIPLREIKNGKWPLFRTFNEAEILGDYKQQQEETKLKIRQEREDEIQALNHEIELMKKERDKAKAESEKQTQDYKMKLLAFEEEANKNKTERERLISIHNQALAAEKAKFEREKTELVHMQTMERSRAEHLMNMQTMDRRDTSDTLKWALGIASTVLSLFAIFYKSKD